MYTDKQIGPLQHDCEMNPLYGPLHPKTTSLCHLIQWKPQSSTTEHWGCSQLQVCPSATQLYNSWAVTYEWGSSVSVCVPCLCKAQCICSCALSICKAMYANRKVGETRNVSRSLNHFPVWCQSHVGCSTCGLCGYFCKNEMLGNFAK